jgi:ectoine hydroxylase-related dioxygenase (phytanoyl-CoA dioxygenase family)
MTWVSKLNYNLIALHLSYNIDVLIQKDVNMDTHSEKRTKNYFIDEMHKDGVSIIKKMIDPEKIKILIQEINSIRDYINAKISKMERPLKKHTDIAERYLNRLDFRCGFTAEIFQQVAEPISEVIKKMSPLINFDHYWGAIPSLGGSGPTNIHRDVYPLLNNTEDVNLSHLDIQLPPYYFTVLIPLVEITRENGPTEFIKGSHKKEIVDEKTSEIYAPLTSPGDIVIFEGRTLHRGSANNSTKERMIAYITYTAEWYHDQTFVVNNYLFPELAKQNRSR